MPNLPVRLPGGWHPPGSPCRPLSEEPPASLDRGLALSVWLAPLLRRQNLEHPCAAHRAHALHRGPAVRHFHLLGVRNLALGLALHTVALIGCHRGLSTLRHCVPPFGGTAGGRGAPVCVRGGSPGSPPPGTETT